MLVKGICKKDSHKNIINAHQKDAVTITFFFDIYAFSTLGFISKTLDCTANI